MCGFAADLRVARAAVGRREEEGLESNQVCAGEGATSKWGRGGFGGRSRCFLGQVDGRCRRWTLVTYAFLIFRADERSRKYHVVRDGDGRDWWVRPEWRGHVNSAESDVDNLFGEDRARFTSADIPERDLQHHPGRNGQLGIAFPTAGKSSDSRRSTSDRLHQFTTPDLSFLNSLIPELGGSGLSPPNPFFPNTSPTSSLPVNWGPRASTVQPPATLPQIANLTKSTLMSRRTGKGKEGGSVDSSSISGTPVGTLPPRLAVVESLLQ